MIKVINGKNVNIPDKEIANFVKTLEISEEEAIQMWLDDNDYTTNEQVEELTKKAKANKTDKVVAQNDKRQRKQVERKPKENPLKQAIINDIYNFLSKNATITNVKIENPTKIITFIAEGKEFKLDLIEKRVKKAWKIAFSQKK